MIFIDIQQELFKFRCFCLPLISRDTFHPAAVSCSREAPGTRWPASRAPCRRVPSPVISRCWRRTCCTFYRHMKACVSILPGGPLGDEQSWKPWKIQWTYHGSLNVPIEHHPTIRYMVYNGYYKVHLPTPEYFSIGSVHCAIILTGFGEPRFYIYIYQ